MAENNNAYIGYRRAGRRPESQQDRRSAADAPLSALRGFASGVLGAPGDIESLIRMLPGLNERTVLPTSADVEKRLPMPELNRTPTGRAFTGAGQLGGGFYAGPGSPLKVIAESPQIIGRAARDFAQSVSPVNVIKPKGGNWLAGSVERALEPMRLRVSGSDPATRIQELQAAKAQNIEAGVPIDEERMASLMSELEPRAAINKWLDQKLGKYIKNEMGTPEDPIRALAERGVLHVSPDQVGINRYRAPQARLAADARVRTPGLDTPGAQMGRSEAARAWEDASDVSITPTEARHLSGMKVNGENVWVNENPWLVKVPPETQVYGLDQRNSSGLGFPHLVDELRNAVNPESGLPANLRLKYSDLEKVTVPQAVERVAKINDWRAAQKAEADMARAMNPATQVVKEYPEQGMRWVELRQPEAPDKQALSKLTDSDMDEIRRAAEERAWGLKDSGDSRSIEEIYDETHAALMKEHEPSFKYEGSKALEDALKYEGETMGHCVGGYCPDVVEGRSKIYSLRDKKGQPHVTIEVQPGDWFTAMTNRSMDDSELFNSELKRRYAAAGINPKSRQPEALKLGNDLYSEMFGSLPPAEIVQIKGKGNKAPKEDYLPAVQDFVRSGNFGRVGDLGNTGLIDIQDPNAVLRALGKVSPERNIQQAIDNFNAAVDSAPNAQRYMSLDEMSDFLGGPSPEGFASGGAVETAASGAGEYNPAKIQSLVDSLREEMYG
jgi:hypothetical protein